MSLTSRKRILLSTAIFLISFSGLYAQDHASVSVEILRGGDDGLTNKLSDAIESAFATSDAFALKRGDKNKTLTITIPTNVHWKRIDNHNEVFYTVELKQSSPERTETDSGSCRDDKLSVCADRIFRSALAFVKGGAVEWEKDLGHGFLSVQIARPVPSGFESLVHYSYLFLERRDLGMANSPCVSLTGLHAIFEDPPTGVLKLFSTKEGRLTDLTSGAVGIPVACDWNEPGNTVRIDFFKSDESSLFRLE
jgi:hypothetical protein